MLLLKNLIVTCSIIHYSNIIFKPFFFFPIYGSILPFKPYRGTFTTMALYSTIIVQISAYKQSSFATAVAVNYFILIFFYYLQINQPPIYYLLSITWVFILFLLKVQQLYQEFWLIRRMDYSIKLGVMYYYNFYIQVSSHLFNTKSIGSTRIGDFNYTDNLQRISVISLKCDKAEETV